MRAVLRALAALLGVLAVWARLTRTHPSLDELPAGPRRTVLTDDGVPLSVEVGGRPDAGTTVVLVHGFLARSMEFDPQWAALAAHARVVRYDHRGHGRSGRTRGAVDLDRLARDLGTVLDAVAPTGPLVLVGHSMGGMTVLALAGQRPDLFRDRVRGVGLLATGAGHAVEGHPVENALRVLARLRVFALQLWLLRLLAPLGERLRPRRTRLLRLAVRHALFGRDDATPDLVRQVQDLLEEPPLTTLTGLHGALLRVDERDGLPVLRGLPVVVVAGEDDRLTRVEHAHELARDLGPTVELVVLPGVGHVLTRSRPVPVTAALLRLLDRVEAGQVAA